MIDEAAPPSVLSVESSEEAQIAPPLRRRPRSAAQVEKLVAQAREDGGLLLSRLDDFLAEPRGFATRLESLISALGDLPLVVDPAEAGAAPTRLRLPGVGDDDGLRGYLRQLGTLERLNKATEGRMARRMEFGRRRLERAVRDAGLDEGGLEDLLGEQFSRSYQSDLDFRPDEQAEDLDRDRRLALRARAREFTRIRSEFVERSLGLVVDLALAYRTYGVPLMDLIQEGNGALIRAVEKFDWRKDVRFQTYSTFWVRQAIERCIAFNKGIVRVPNYLQQKMRRLRREGILPKRDRDVSIAEVSEAFEVKPEVAGHLLQTERAHYSLDVAVDDEGQTFASLLADEHGEPDLGAMEFQQLRERLEEVLHTLSELEREILALRFGLGGGDPLTLEEVGRRMEVSRERIRQIQVRAIRKLQRPGLIQKLAGFV